MAKKNVPLEQEKDAEPCLFGWHLIDPRARTVCIAEGEIDAMTLHQVGFPALSVNAGAGNHQWIESDWDRLERFSDILLCFDDDEAGRKGAREVAHRLGIERCRLVVFAAKDANQGCKTAPSVPTSTTPCSALRRSTPRSWCRHPNSWSRSRRCSGPTTRSLRSAAFRRSAL